ncbi:hypothetical protein ElyMa_002814800 [Elysia marginata]|uniref:IMS import disulfide relay-system CHCH-CHCH-like Cx9C domain-containing protein n=1 Tax=Elysia marginata TaxID=1093978 RepID=A0AAV4HRF9_9GAST|nr:hypothetical protein ElyMa_002814800 [Elysia marginata]
MQRLNRTTVVFLVVHVHSEISRPNNDFLFCLFTVISAAATPEDQKCDENLMACLREHAVRLGSQDGSESCGIIKDFSDCVSALECLSQGMRDEIITNVSVSIKTIINCDKPMPQSPQEEIIPGKLICF